MSSGEQKWPILQLVLIVEIAALLIGLAMPITPSKTGRAVSLARWFYEDPSYLQEVLVYFLLTNLLLVLLALAAFVIIRIERRIKSRREA